jgi:hypothetical protein
MQAPGPIIASFGRDCPPLRVHTLQAPCHVPSPLWPPPSLARRSLAPVWLVCSRPSACLPASSLHRTGTRSVCSVQSTAQVQANPLHVLPSHPGLALFALLRPPPGVRESARTPTHFRTPGAHCPPPPPFHPNLSPSFVLSPASPPGDLQQPSSRRPCLQVLAIHPQRTSSTVPDTMT